jgi:hypothetical protein
MAAAIAVAMSGANSGQFVFGGELGSATTTEQ